MRSQRELSAKDLSKYQKPLDIAMKDAVDRKILPSGTTMNHSVLIRSRPPCPKQDWHKDVQYKVMFYRGRYVSLFVAIMNNTILHLKYKKKGCDKNIIINKGDYIVFGGRVVHAGAAYSIEHFRLFAYIGVGIRGQPEVVQKKFPNCTVLESDDTSSDVYEGGEYHSDSGGE